MVCGFQRGFCGHPARLRWALCAVWSFLIMRLLGGHGAGGSNVPQSGLFCERASSEWSSHGRHIWLRTRMKDKRRLIVLHYCNELLYIWLYWSLFFRFVIILFHCLASYIDSYWLFKWLWYWLVDSVFDKYHMDYYIDYDQIAYYVFFFWLIVLCVFWLLHLLSY